MDIRLKLVSFLARNADQKFTINEIAESTKEHYSFVHRTIKQLFKEEVISSVKAGKAYLCSLNVNNEKTLALIQLSEIEKKNEFYGKNKELRIILEDFVKSLIETRTNVLSVVLFGSYSKGNATEESDIDILLLSKKNLNVEGVAREMYAKYGKEINSIVMTSKNFIKQKDQALIKEIMGNHHLLYGAENFVRIVFKK